jgi:hypothetical protein
MDISHDHISFGPQIPFLGSEGLFLPFWPPKAYLFLLHVTFLIDGYVTRSYWFWAPNSVFELWRLIFAFGEKFLKSPSHVTLGFLWAIFLMWKAYFQSFTLVGLVVSPEKNIEFWIFFFQNVRNWKKKSIKIGKFK